MKKNLSVLSAFLFVFNLLYAQELPNVIDAKYPVFPGCEKKKTNEELKDCFRTKLIYEVRDVYSLNSFEFDEELKKNSVVLIRFDLKIDGTVENYSYTEDSNPVVSTKILKAIYRLFKDYEKKGKKIQPATVKGKPINYKMKINLSNK